MIAELQHIEDLGLYKFGPRNSSVQLWPKYVRALMNPQPTAIFRFEYNKEFSKALTFTVGYPFN